MAAGTPLFSLCLYPPSSAAVGLPVPDRRRVNWRPRVSRTAGSRRPSPRDAIETELGVRHRRRPPTIHRGTAQQTISAGATNPIGKKTRVNRKFAACQCGARPRRAGRTMRCCRGRQVLTLPPGLSQLACKQMRHGVGVNRDLSGGVRELGASADRGWLVPTRLTAQAE